MSIIQGDTKKRELLKTPTKFEVIQEKKIIDRNWTITTCLLRDSNPDYQCSKITSCRWRPPPRTHSFTVTTHFKSSRSFVSPCVCCMLCRMRLCIWNDTKMALSNLYFDVHYILNFKKRLGFKIFYGSYRRYNVWIMWNSLPCMILRTK